MIVSITTPSKGQSKYTCRLRKTPKSKTQTKGQHKTKAPSCGP